MFTSRWKLCTVAQVCVLLFAGNSFAQEANPPLAAPPPPTKALETGSPIEVPLQGNGRSLGKASSKLILMEFTDYECPYCAQFHAQTFPTLKTQFIDKGQLLFVVRDLPLDIHPFAFKMAKAAHCGDTKGSFWKVDRILYQQLPKLRDISDDTALANIARQASISSTEFRKCVASNQFDDDIKKSIVIASSANITATPTFILGHISGDRLSGIAIVGAIPTDRFVETIETELAKK
jgi:protein-disulfide isomerase